MAKKPAAKINWDGNNGYLFPAPGKMKTANCDIWGSQMNVKRNVLGPTSWIESMGKGKHLHDSFSCPSLSEGWHEKIVELKSEARNTASEKIKKILEDEILEILKKHAAR